MVVEKHGREKVKVNGYTKHRWRCPKCGRAAPEDFCIVHGDVNAVDITKNKKLQKLGLSYTIRTEKTKKPKPTTLKKGAVAYLKKHGYTGLISGEFLAKQEKLGVSLTELKRSHLDLLIQADKEAKAREKERKRKDIIGKQNRARAKKKTGTPKTKKKSVKPKTKETDMGMELEKLIAKKAQIKVRQSQRTPRARTMDSKKRAKRIVKRDRYDLWLKHPERYDIEGVDT